MSKLHIFYDPLEPSLHFQEPPRGVLHASLNVADDIESQDIYAIARKLAELLLEQVRE